MFILQVSPFALITLDMQLSGCFVLVGQNCCPFIVVARLILRVILDLVASIFSAVWLL